jgi:hypothetical protein
MGVDSRSRAALGVRTGFRVVDSCKQANQTGESTVIERVPLLPITKVPCCTLAVVRAMAGPFHQAVLPGACCACCRQTSNRRALTVRCQTAQCNEIPCRHVGHCRGQCVTLYNIRYGGWVIDATLQQAPRSAPALLPSLNQAPDGHTKADVARALVIDLSTVKDSQQVFGKLGHQHQAGSCTSMRSATAPAPKYPQPPHSIHPPCHTWLRDLPSHSPLC